MTNIKYEIDPHNKLVVVATGNKSPLRRFRKIVDGKFAAGKDGTLIYHVKSPIPGVITDRFAPHQLRMKGKWSLDKDHNLVLTLNKWRRQVPGDELILQGQLIDVEKNALFFAVTTRTKKSTASTYILKLEGSWQADKHNRLTFRVRKNKKGFYDTLTFNGIWEIDKDHRIVYTYKKALSKKGKKVKKVLSFDGFWDIKEKYRLSYDMGLKGESGFKFKTSLGILDRRFIRYELGIGLSRKNKPKMRSVILYGTWMIRKNTGLIFKIEREQGGAQIITFGAKARLNKDSKVEFKLKSKKNKDLSMNLILSKNLLKGDGESFIRLLKTKKQIAIYAGMAWRW